MTEDQAKPKHPRGFVSRCDPEFLRLALCYLENELPPGALPQLKDYLESNPLNREAFVRLSFAYTAAVGELRSQSLLKNMDRQNQSGDAVIMPALSTSESSQTLATPLVEMLDWDRRDLKSTNADKSGLVWRTRSWLAFGGLAAAVVIMALMIWRMTSSPPAPRAVLVESIHAHWLGGRTERVGHAMPSGMIQLARGTAEFRTRTGVTVVVQAPARLRIQSGQRIWLSSGKIVAKVPHTSVGFTVQTLYGSLIDLGTEFGVSQQPGKPTYAEVFQGHVAVARVGHTAKSAVPRIIGSSQAVNMSNNRIVSARPMSFMFVRPREVAYWAKLRLSDKKALSPADQGYLRWLAFSHNLSESPNLRAYYTFTPEPARPNQLVNQAIATRGKYDGQFGYPGVPDSNPVWVPGRWATSQVLKFVPSRRTAVALQVGPHFVPIHAITIAVWLKPASMIRTDHIINQIRKTDPRFNFCWLGSAESDFTPRGIYFDWGTGRVISTPVLPTQSAWTFLAVTARARGHVRFYVNGKLVCTRPCPPPPVAKSMSLLIGAPGLLNVGTEHMYMQGKIGELAIFNRVLGQGDVDAMYRAGRPARMIRSGK